MSALWWVVFGIVVVLFALAIYARANYIRSHRRLTYEWRYPTKGGVQQLSRAFAENFEAMTWGTSLGAWRRRCEASLRASRRRRGLD